MNKINSASKIKLNSFNDLFGMNDSMRETGEIREVLIDDLYDFHDHPFKPISKEKMDELVKSVSENGVLTPGVARIRPQGGYEIIAGHNRREACRRAGISTMPMFIRNLSDDEAIIAMVDSNIQREDILPSEKAKAYRMRYEAMKSPGKKGNSLEIIGADSGDSVKSVQRYLWLSRLNDELLDMVDRKKLGIVQGSDISFLKEKEQGWVLTVLKESRVKITKKQSDKLKKLSQEKLLTEDTVKEMLILPENTSKSKKVVFDSEKLSKYFSDEYSEESIEEIIVSLLDKWMAEKKKMEGD